jgi:hypothetical protein
MNIWRRRGLRALLSGVFAAALMFGGMSASAATAGVGFGDTMDTYLPGQWSFEHNGSYGGGGFEYNQGTAFSPQNNAWVAANYGWSALKRHVNVPGSDPDMSDLCTASIYIKPAVNDSVTFNLEVLKAGTYEYVALRQVTLLPGGYKQVSVSWRADLDEVDVRFSLLSNHGYYKKARLDHFYVYCQYAPL